MRIGPLLRSFEVGRVLDLVLAASLYDVPAALLLPNSLDRVPMRNRSVALVQLSTMRSWVLQIAVVLVLRTLGAPDQALLLATD